MSLETFTEQSQKFASYTDIHIQVSGKNPDDIKVNLAASLLFPGPERPIKEYETALQELAQTCALNNRDDFMIQRGKTFYRGRRDANAVDGLWYRLRVMPETPPELEFLPSPLPEQYVRTLLDPSLSRGGLIYVAGGAGCGKTTTASATVISRLKAYGGMAFTIEDPPELPLNGQHGSGYCTQTLVAGDRGTDWVESMRGVLRSQPVGTKLMLYVGEIRDEAAARVMLRAASNGFLVICTGFANDVMTAIDSLLQQVGPSYCQTLSQVLRVVLYQRIVDGHFTSSMLEVDERVQNIIRTGQLASLQDEIRFQRNAMAMRSANPAKKTITVVQ